MTLFRLADKAALNIKTVLGVSRAYDDQQLYAQNPQGGSIAVNPSEGRYLVCVHLGIPGVANTVHIRYLTQAARDQAYDNAVSELEDSADF